MTVTGMRRYNAIEYECQITRTNVPELKNKISLSVI